MKKNSFAVDLLLYSASYDAYTVFNFIAPSNPTSHATIDDVLQISTDTLKDRQILIFVIYKMFV